jgi:hypothetical protein
MYRFLMRYLELLIFENPKQLLII